MPTFKFTGPERAALLRDPKGIFPSITAPKGEPFTTGDPAVIALVRELPAFEEVRDEPKSSPKKTDGKS